MTWLSRLLSFFPALIMGLAASVFIWICLSDSWQMGSYRLALLLFVLYGLPLIAYRFHAFFYPVEAGISYLRDEHYSPWWGAHQLQAIYIALPVLETVLRIVPGAFSQWLRLWGSQIGRQVYWGSVGEVADRGLLRVGARALIGHRVGLYEHNI